MQKAARDARRVARRGLLDHRPHLPALKRLALLGALACAGLAASACGEATRGEAVHYHEAAALQCLRQTDAWAATGRPHAVLIAFVTRDSAGFAAFGVGFGHGHDEARKHAAAVRESRVGRFLSLDDPAATGGRGDAAYDDYGVVISDRIVKRQHLTRDSVEREAQTARRRGREAVERCLTENRVGAARRTAARPSLEVAVCLGTIPGAEPIAMSAGDIVARVYRSGAVGDPVIVGSARATDAARVVAQEDLSAAGMDASRRVVWHASRDGVVALGLAPTVDRSAVRAGHLDRAALEASAKALRRRVEPAVRACLRR